MGIYGIHLNAISHIGKKRKNVLFVLITNIIYLLLSCKEIQQKST